MRPPKHNRNTSWHNPHACARPATGVARGHPDLSNPPPTRTTLGQLALPVVAGCDRAGYQTRICINAASTMQCLRCCATRKAALIFLFGIYFCSVYVYISVQYIFALTDLHTLGILSTSFNWNAFFNRLVGVPTYAEHLLVAFPSLCVLAHCPVEKQMKQMMVPLSANQMGWSIAAECYGCQPG
jgi:hypothetical protein